MIENMWRRNNIGRLMNDAVRIFEQRVIELMHEKGFTDLGAAHINLTRHLDETGNRLTELAARAAMTKSSMRELVQQVEHAGLVERRPDPRDGRAKLIMFTPTGLRWLKAFGESLKAADVEIQSIIGAEIVDEINLALVRYIAASTHEPDGATERT